MVTARTQDSVPRDPRTFLLGLFASAVEAADPARLLPPVLPPPPLGRTVVVGAGKAAGSMARPVEDHWREHYGLDARLSGLVVTRYGHGIPCRSIEVVEAGHPLPDAAGAAAARRMLETVAGLSESDLVLALFSGGGSALLTLPAPGMTTADLREVNRQLLRSGATISEINCVRKHLSAIAGGRLATACFPARVITFLISDVPGDDPAVIASGPTVPDPSTFADAAAIVRKYGLSLPPAVARHLAEARDETPKGGDHRLGGSTLGRDVIMLATPADALSAAEAQARACGLATVMLGAELQGEARQLAAQHADLVRRIRLDRPPSAPPALVLSGGETTVTVAGAGRGGRNSEYLLALGVALGEEPGVFALAADTDGVDGTEENAGAFLSPDTLARARETGIDPRAHLEANDSYGFFAGLSDLLVTGPTLTNVNDFRAILIP